jgi:hypothetical protein
MSGPLKNQIPKGTPKNRRPNTYPRLKTPHQRCPAATLLSKDEAQRIAVNIAKLPETAYPIGEREQ